MIIHFFCAAAIVALVLLQRGKGAEAGAGFGAGASGTVFGARGASTALSRATAILAGLFMITSLSLAYVGTRKSAPVEQPARSAVAAARGAGARCRRRRAGAGRAGALAPSGTGVGASGAALEQRRTATAAAPPAPARPARQQVALRIHADVVELVDTLA